MKAFAELFSTSDRDFAYLLASSIATDQVIATEELLKEWIFDKKKAEVIFALDNGKIVKALDYLLI